MIRPANSNDWPRIQEIYIQGIATKNATFESAANVATYTYEQWSSGKINESISVYTVDEHVVGWCSLSLVSSRAVYAGVTEVSVYVDTEQRGKGIGSVLLDHLIAFSENNNIWTLQCGIFPENIPSIQLHLNKGFRTVGTREKIGKMDAVWRDVTFLERRSTNI